MPIVIGIVLIAFASIPSARSTLLKLSSIVPIAFDTDSDAFAWVLQRCSIAPPAFSTMLSRSSSVLIAFGTILLAFLTVLPRVGIVLDRPSSVPIAFPLGE